MTFKPRNFRRITSADELRFKIRTADYTTLILVKNSGEAMYARTRADKDRLIEEFDGKIDLLLLVWPGEHHTDVFLLNQEDVVRHYR
jgi:hypothetical protein